MAKIQPFPIQEVAQLCASTVSDHAFACILLCKDTHGSEDKPIILLRLGSEGRTGWWTYRPTEKRV